MLTKPRLSRLFVMTLLSAAVAAKMYAGCSVTIVTSVTPNTGPTAGGTAVTITGSGFFNPSTVTFGGVAATNVVFVNGTTITATTPAHAAGAVDVAVTDGGVCLGNPPGTLTNGFTYTAPVQVPALSPLALALLAAMLLLIGVWVMKK